MSRSALATPMMRQFLALKESHPDAILFFRMGDFYEMFLQDAELAAPLLEITLTTRDRGKPDAVPMCGVPAHSVDQYVKKLARLGHRVAICEQVEDPRQLGGRRLVKRAVVEVVTPGLVGDPEGLSAGQEVALAALAPPDADGSFGLAALEASTGDFRATREAAGAGALLPAALAAELERIDPREILVPGDAAELADALAARLPHATLTRVEPATLAPAGVPSRPEGFAPDAGDAAHRAAAALLHYLHAHQPFALRHTARLRHYALGDTMVLDAATRTHLELFQNNEDRTRRNTLLERVDATVTPPGLRRLARWLAYPLRDPAAIAERQEAVAWLVARDRLRGRLRERLREVRDLERLVARVARPAATPRDLVALRFSLEALPEVARALAEDGEDGLPGTQAPRPPWLAPPEPVAEAAGRVAEALVDDAPALPRGSRGAGETGFVRDGYRPELDALREAARKGREWIAGLEQRERERAGIPNLKLRFHPVHGYGIEVTKAQLARVPEDYERRQTLANAERFTTPELREVEGRVLGAHERAAAMEREIFESLRQEVLAGAPAMVAAADAVARLDVLAALAEVARREGWSRPRVDDGDEIEIVAGRHPVVEPLAVASGSGFVPNDTRLGARESRILLLTGPNMSGKSTYLRQVALIVLLAHVGSFVPAEDARIGAVDRIFTRVGAADRLARGESTFMVEMRECADILAHASPRSLVILDELGRGTSTWDGLSIAWSVVEYLHDTPGLRPWTLFATHYHELTELAEGRERIANAHFEVRSHRGDVIFLRRLVPGGANRSYGIEVARLAGLPESVLRRARSLLHALESGGGGGAARARLAETAQLGLFEPGDRPSGTPPAGDREVLAALREVDPDRTTPLDALATLSRLVERLRRDAEAG